jgi:class 3 adenylate cyclase/tetratricopeptide (TPR) repeat protein
VEHERTRVHRAERRGTTAAGPGATGYGKMPNVSGGTGGAWERRVGTLPTGVVSFVLTDVEGSTAMWDRDPTATASAIERHDELIAGIVASFDGILLKHKGEGDSTMSVFRRATDAVSAASAIVGAVGREAWPGELAVMVRVAAHTGEAFEREGDYYGPTVNRVARVRGLANGGQVLLTRATAELVVDHLPDGCSLRDHGRHELRGITRAERVFELVGSAAAPAATSPFERPAGRSADGVDVADEGADQRAAVAAQADSPSLPAALRAETAFVGRSPELTQLLGAWDSVPRAGIRLALLSGEPGIGKTRLSAALAERVAGDGLVWFGRCEQDLSAPYQPFIEGLRPWLAALDPPSLGSIPESVLAWAARLWPEITGRVPSLPMVRFDDPEQERHACFEAVVELLSVASSERPLLFVIDDLHWANAPTVLMLRHVLNAAQPVSALILCTYRDAEVSSAHPFAGVMDDARRSGSAVHLQLAGLDRAEIAKLVADAEGVEPGEDLDDAVARLEAQTSGNPFFLSEVIAAVGLPTGVRDVVSRRVGALTDDAQKMLAVAAVLGAEVDYDDVAAAVEDDRRAGLLDALDAALVSGLLIERGDRLAFKHAIVRDCVLDGLSRQRRARLHEQIGLAIEATPDADDRCGELAFHFLEAGTQPEKAARFAFLRADRALQLLALEEAGAGFEVAAEQLRRARSADPLLAIDVDLGRADVLRAGGAAACRELLIDVLARAVAVAAFDRAATAAMTLTLTVGLAGTDLVADRAIADACIAAVEAPPVARSQLLSALSLLKQRGGACEMAQQIGREAVELARGSGSDVALFWASQAVWTALLAVGSIDDRRAIVAEMLEVVRRPGLSDLAFRVSYELAVDCIEVGDRLGAERAVDDMRGTGAGWVALGAIDTPTRLDAFIALLDGRWTDAQTLGDRALAEWGNGEISDAAAAYAGLVALLGRERGQHESILPLIDAAIEADPDFGAYQAGRALLVAEHGDLGAARQAVDRVLSGGVAGIRRDLEFGATLGMLAEAVAVLSDAALAAELMHELAAFSGRLLMLQEMVAPIGAADRFLGMLSHAVGEYDAALAAFDRAIALETKLAAPPLVARTQLWKARLHVSRGEPDLAADCASACLATAEQLGMAKLVELAQGLALRG